jgi:NADPH:quinone reductase-like Zn-dependent oxidoreductase
LTLEHPLASDIDRSFNLEHAAKAHDYLEHQTAYGRVVLKPV